MSPDPKIALDLHRLVLTTLDQWHDVSKSDMVIC